MALILDTGPLYAIYDRADDHHKACRRLLESTDEELLIPAPVLVEFDFLALRSNIKEAPAILLEDILDGAFGVVALTFDDYVRCREVITQYADASIGFVDAAVLAVTERLREPKLATLDRRHFGFLRPKHVPALELLPRE